VAHRLEIVFELVLDERTQQGVLLLPALPVRHQHQCALQKFVVLAELGELAGDGLDLPVVTRLLGDQQVPVDEFVEQTDVVG
jgi:hypothetical protein